MKQLLSDTKGQTLIFIALAFVVLGLFLGIAVDGGRAYLLRARLSKVVDAASLAGARHLALGFDEAKDAACDSAKVSGFACVEDGGTVTVVQVIAPTPACPSPTCVSVTASEIMSTSFMRLGTLIGCGAICEQVNVLASASAVAETLIDVVIVHDDTGSMGTNPCCPPICDFLQDDLNCPIRLAREGAKAFVDLMLFPESNAQISLVPFRGCYNTAGNNGCVDSDDEIINLTDTDNKTDLIGTRGDRPIPGSGCTGTGCPDNGTGIDGLWAQGGSDTNICLGMDRGRKVLFGAGSRFTARKAMVILTDAENIRLNPGLPDCAASSLNQVDVKTNDKATVLKDPDGDNIEIFVLGYSIDGAPNTTLFCNVSAISGGNDRNLAKCIASSKTGTNDHYFEAVDETQIPTIFEAIAKELLKRLRLV